MTKETYAVEIKVDLGELTSYGNITTEFTYHRKVTGPRSARDAAIETIAMLKECMLRLDHQIQESYPEIPMGSLLTNEPEGVHVNPE